VVALVDQDPDSEVIRRLPAPIATLLKSTEPYLEDYFRLDLPAALAEAGFRNCRREATDPRHRVWWRPVDPSEPGSSPRAAREEVLGNCVVFVPISLYLLPLLHAFPGSGCLSQAASR
jgi:hypothetical protein